MDNAALAKAVTEIVIEASVPLKKYFGAVEKFSAKSTSAADVVTELDKSTELFLSERLKKLSPKINFYGEETSSDIIAEPTWIVDPIDGTAHFIRGIPFATTMVALADKGELQLSVIYNFVTDELFVAVLGQGATRNGVPIHVSSRPIDQAYLTFEGRLDTKADQDLFLKFHNKVVTLATISCGFEYGLIAQGKLDGRIGLRPYGKVYDFAPGNLLVKEAGGKVTTIGSDKYDYKNTSYIATNSFVHNALTKGDDALFPLKDRV